jgi:hypothetical protein
MTAPESANRDGAPSFSEREQAHNWARAEFLRRGLPYDQEEFQWLVRDGVGVSFEELFAALQRVAQAA